MDNSHSLLLIDAPPWSPNSPPLSIYTLHAKLNDRGILCNCFNLNLSIYEKHKETYVSLWDMQNHEEWFALETKYPDLYQSISRYLTQIARPLANSKYEFLGFSIAAPKQIVSYWLIRLIKNINPHKKIILGGPLVTTKNGRDEIAHYFQDSSNGWEYYVDAIFESDSEQELIDYIEGNLNTNKSKVISKQKHINPFSDGVFPTYTKSVIEQYKKNTDFTINIEWSRGCTNRCRFCNIEKFQPVYFSKPPHVRYKEIRFLYKAYGIRNISLCDSLINGNMQDLRKTCELLIKNNININWSGQFRVRKDLTKKDFVLFKKAGCNRLEFGIESFSQTVLDNMNKKINLRDIRKNIKWSKNAGIETVVYLIIGFPGETEKEFTKTYKFLKKYYVYIDLIRSVRQLYIVPGSYVAENLDKYNITKLPLKEDLQQKRWYIRAENTYKIRMNRVQKIIDLCKQKNISYELHDVER